MPVPFGGAVAAYQRANEKVKDKERAIGKKIADYRPPWSGGQDKGADKPPTTVKAAEKPSAEKSSPATRRAYEDPGPPAKKPAPTTRRAYEDPGPSGGSTAKKKQRAKPKPKSTDTSAGSKSYYSQLGDSMKTEQQRDRSKAALEKARKAGPETESGDRKATVDEKKPGGFKGGAHKPRRKSFLRRAAGGVGKYAGGVVKALAGKRASSKR